MRSVCLSATVAALGRLRESREWHAERGLTTTEVAVLTFILVAIAVAMGTVLYGYASNTVNSAPAGGDLTPGIPNG